jgi:hypothetical protein
LSFLMGPGRLEMAICALCKKDAELRKSHIIPEFLYKTMYDDKHRFHVLSSVPDLQDAMAQKGLRERLLCDTCEGLLSKLERYARGVLSGGETLDWSRDGSVIYVSGIDYTRFKLFQLSILWRAGVSKSPMFKKVVLGPHEPILREMLITADAGSEAKYPCLTFGLVDDTGQRMDMIVQPERLRIEGHRVYRFIIGGFMWVFFVTTRQPAGKYKVGFLQKSGKLSFVIKNVFEAKFMRTFGEARARLGRVE